MTRKAQLTAALVALCLGGATPAAAKIEKTVISCKQGDLNLLCPVFTPSFKAPQGWTTDVESQKAQGVKVFLPPGTKFSDAPALIYGEARPNPEKTPLAAWVATSDQRWTQAKRGSKVSDAPSTPLGADKRPVIVHRYANPTLKGQPIEIIGYFEENDDAGNAYVVRLTLTGFKDRDVAAARPAFDEMLRNY